MRSCCSSGNNEALNHEEDQARGDLECMLRELEGAEDEKSSMVQESHSPDVFIFSTQLSLLILKR